MSMSEAPLFQIEDLHAGIEGNEILRGVNLTINRGEIHALMGKNGSGKSTLAYAVAGHPNYEVTQGSVLYKGENVLEMGPDERAQLGMFLAFQYPTSIPGVSMANFLRMAANSRRGRRAEAGEEGIAPFTPREFRKTLREKMALLKMDESFASRYLNEGFSGGEKKRAEILQMAMLEPEFCIMDETDSGLDIDALRTVSDGVNALFNPSMAMLVITHYQRLLNYIKPNFVHIMAQGQIVKSGGPELAQELEDLGYDQFMDKYVPDFAVV
jgi:Fe-S cluster assembly ATP-binding protein